MRYDRPTAIFVFLSLLALSGCGDDKELCETCSSNRDCADGLTCVEFEGHEYLCAANQYTECAKKSSLTAP